MQGHVKAKIEEVSKKYLDANTSMELHAKLSEELPSYNQREQKHGVSDLRCFSRYLTPVF